MPRTRLTLTVFALRLLLAAACLLPFTSVASAAVYFPSLLAAGDVAPAPVSEEDEREEEETAKQRAAQERHGRSPDRAGARLHPPCLLPRPLTSPTRPTAADPFRNGLGTPFRC